MKPTPYYEQDGVTIYCGDNRQILPLLGEFDLLLTDPPYNIGSWSSTGGNSLSEQEASAVNNWDLAVQPEQLEMAISAAGKAIIWGGNYLLDMLGKCRAPLVWDKGIRGMHFADGEMAWTNFDWGTLRILNSPVASGDTKGRRLHPTQKPTDVLIWCLSQAKLEPGMTVLDPWMGSGTTLVAAKLRGLKAVGIEINEDYCKIAVERLRQRILIAV